MSEQRLIDANDLIERGNTCFGGVSDAVLLKHFVDAQPTIDLESIPLVRQLREELEQAKSERDAAFELIGWIYYEACVSVEHDMRQHIDWLKDKIEEWKKNRRK